MSIHSGYEHDTVPSALDALERRGPDCATSPVFDDLDRLWARMQAHPAERAPRFGEALVAAGLLSRGQLQLALARQQEAAPHDALGEQLVKEGVLSRAQLRQMLAAWQGIPTVDLDGVRAEPDALAQVPRAIALRESVCPLMVRDAALVVAVADPWDHHLLDVLRFVSELPVRPVLAQPGTLMPAIARAYHQAAGDATEGAEPPAAGKAIAPSVQAQTVRELARQLVEAEASVSDADAGVVAESDNTLVRLVNRLIADAVELGASDIHIETFDAPRPVRVRLRIDGDLVRYLDLPARVRFALVARLKVMADLDISEHRRPQDGKIDFARFGGTAVELRLVTVPTSAGLEDVVLRLLGGMKSLALDEIDLAPANLEALRQVMAKPYGLLLICGPTGCGKTTTLHSVMRELNQDKRKIWTAEDPIEISQEGLRQVQVNSRIGWTFAAAMRTFLRADPDVIMIGEMRDEETARIAVEASLTGHLVMSTLHTNSASESVTRLLEIGLDPFMFSDSLLAVLAQRLVRRLCKDCRRVDTLDDHAARSLAQLYLQTAVPGVDADQLLDSWKKRYGDAEGRLHQYRHQGCDACGGTGYRGRLGIHELLVAGEDLRALVRRRSPAREMLELALRSGMRTLRQDGIEKVLAGLTDLPEVLAASNP